MKMIKIIFILPAILFICCEEESAKSNDESLSTGRDTWKIIQEDIFTPNCVECHMVGTSFANQSNLILTPDVAYEQLTNQPVDNQAALNDGLERVGTDGLSSLYKSYLWEKINAPDKEHYYGDHPNYGSLMPLGLPYLTNGQLEFIRQWIIAGALETGVVADSTLFSDTTRFEEIEFAALTPPVTGLQIHLGPFDVQPHYEREFLYFTDLDTSGDIYVNKVEITMRPGSHHFIMYTFQNIMPDILIPESGVYRDLRDANGQYIIDNLTVMYFHDFFTGTQWPYISRAFPPGMALKIDADKGLDLNSHYINRSDEVLTGEVYTNIHMVDPSEVEHVVEILTLNHNEFELPPNEITTLERTFTFNQRTHIIQLLSHAHEHNLEFAVEIVGGSRDGELIYIAYDWEHPPILELDPPLTLEAGEGLRLIATYDNWTNETLTFGLLSEDEMMIVFGYFYTD